MVIKMHNVFRGLLFFIAITSDMCLETSEVTPRRILVLPGMSTGSTYLYMKRIGQYLLRRGHHVTILINTAVMSLDSVEECRHTFTSTETYEYRDDYALSSDEKPLMGYDTWWKWLERWQTRVPECDLVLSQSALLSRLHRTKYDLVIANVFVVCPILLAQQLNMYFVLVGNNRISPVIEGSMCNVPLNPSYVPAMGSALTSKMNFVQRLTNTINYVLAYIFFNFLMLPPYAQLKEKYRIRPEISMTELFTSADLFFFNTDFAFDYPQPFMPNVVFIGGVIVTPVKDLDEELEEFMQSSKDHGVVIFSLGSYHNPRHFSKLGMIVSVFARLPQKVIMKYSGPPIPTLGNNTKLLEWMPQNDLLGHPKTRAFVSHCGLNGVHEAIYNGVPVVGIPVAINDQVDNIAWLADKGMAIAMDLKSMTEDGLYDAITEIINNERYTNNAKKLSHIYRDWPLSPGDTIVYWIEHVIKHGGEHLRSEGGHLNIVQYYLIDISAFLLFVGVIIVVVMNKIIQILCNEICKLGKHKEKV
ncbi:UDP-glucuronosyltransferase 2C1-like [Saccoglossus kowalevskii]|uniref:UDP-glucuronosyltransferase 2C1-like n=1 Tax=Saccoglossus kowalevskii TaxID=10224 RepID=A0ABM0GQI9_SACKO|nr:PREDICTED: UDP-glucuronosyltransferase 2C1-like [Saccoglossus kowalevskii]